MDKTSTLNKYDLQINIFCIVVISLYYISQFLLHGKLDNNWFVWLTIVVYIVCLRDFVIYYKNKILQKDIESKK